MGRGGLVLMAMGALAGSASGAEKAGDVARPSFSGSWTLKPEESDDGRAKMKEAMGERRGGRRGPVGGGPMSGGPRGGPGGQGPMSGGPVGERGGPPMAGPMGGGPDAEQMAAMREAMDAAIESPESLLISQDGVAFEMVMDGERAVRLYADGRKNKGATGVERKTKWEEDRLVTESKVGGGFGPSVKITETWAMVPAPAQGTAEPGTLSQEPLSHQEPLSPLPLTEPHRRVPPGSPSPRGSRAVSSRSP